jgi:hypothetical protein
MKQKYIEKKFRAESLRLIAICDKILHEYIDAGYVITVRTLYYQLVARDIIPNKEESYKNLTGLVNDARLAGLLDWDVIEDRGRRPVLRPRWGNGGHFLRSVMPQYHSDMWANQPERVFVVVEKDALAGVLERLCHKYDVPLLAARGYPSASSVRDLVHEQVFPYIFRPGYVNRGKHNNLKAANERQTIVFLHMGDHDPSGIDMSRDLEQRLQLFGENTFRLNFERIALNMEQIEEVNPPPNPAKSSDSRFKDYQDKFGNESWELDALTPDYLNDLLEGQIKSHIDETKWDERTEELDGVRQRLTDIAENFED